MSTLLPSDLDRVHGTGSHALTDCHRLVPTSFTKSFADYPGIVIENHRAPHSSVRCFRGLRRTRQIHRSSPAGKQLRIAGVPRASPAFSTTHFRAVSAARLTAGGFESPRRSSLRLYEDRVERPKGGYLRPSPPPFHAVSVPRDHRRTKHHRHHRRASHRSQRRCHRWRKRAGDQCSNRDLPWVWEPVAGPEMTGRMRGQRPLRGRLRSLLHHHLNPI